ncbi:MAG: ribonuclease Z [Gemmatimonadota bacterium]
MPLSVRFLGTSASRPTVERGVSSLALIREGETFLIDCGEGTQRQMMRYGISFALNDILFTHFHVDHFLGVVGLLRTLSLQGRSDALRCWGPRGAARFLHKCETLGADRLTFPLDVREVEPGDVIRRSDFAIHAADADHRGPPALNWALVEETRRGRFDPDQARALGIPEGPLWARLHRGETVTLADGRVIESSTLVGPPRSARRVVITGDTRPCQATLDAARNADLLIHEATFADEEADRARETGHSTAREAASIARDAGVRRLILTHISARYSGDPGQLEREARQVFGATTVARDGMEIVVPYVEVESAVPEAR